MRNICLIPARSGSKGLKDKNMAYLNGKPLILHTIEAALCSNIFKPEDIYISTDSEEYIEHLNSENLGISLYHRNIELATDDAPTSKVVVDFLEKFHMEDINLILLQPTSPFRTDSHIKEAYNLFLKNNYKNAIVSICEVDKNPMLFTELGENGELTDIVEIDKNYKRQNHIKKFVPNGAIYIIKKSDYLLSSSFFTERTIGYKMDRKSSIDIDTYDDYINAIGNIFFDYKKRELENYNMYEKKFVGLVDNKFEKIIIGDSRTENINVDGYLNMSIGGVTLVTMVRLVKKYLNCSQYESVIINLGINDIIVGYNDEQKEKAMLDLIKEFSNSKIIICNIFPTIYRPNINNVEILKFNKFISAIKNVEILDAYSLFENKSKLNYVDTYDGLHLVNMANNKFQKFIVESLNDC